MKLVDKIRCGAARNIRKGVSKMITLAVQKSGRLNSQTDKLLKDCGISFINGSEKKLKANASNFPMQILYLRDDDIPECIADGARQPFFSPGL